MNKKVATASDNNTDKQTYVLPEFGVSVKASNVDEAIKLAKKASKK